MLDSLGPSVFDEPSPLHSYEHFDPALLTKSQLLSNTDETLDFWMERWRDCNGLESPKASRQLAVPVSVDLPRIMSHGRGLRVSDLDRMDLSDEDTDEKFLPKVRSSIQLNAKPSLNIGGNRKRGGQTGTGTGSAGGANSGKLLTDKQRALFSSAPISRPKYTLRG